MASVTVVVPTYERADLIGEAVSSALAQTYDDLIVLVGDNSESDDTEELLAAIDDPRLRYHRNRPGLGPMGNWLDLIQRSETPLVATLHDDDRWHPEFLAATAPGMLDDPSIGMTFTDFWVIDDHGNALRDYTEAESARTHRDRLPEGVLQYDYAQSLRLVAVWNAPQPAYAAVLRRDAMVDIEFPDDISPLYDIWLSYQLARRGSRFRYVPRRLTDYRVHLGAATSTGFKQAEDAVFRRIVDENADEPEVVEEITAYWSTLRWARATRLMAGGPTTRVESQEELRAAAQGLAGPKRLVALGAGRVDPVWHALRLARAARVRAATRVGDVRYAPVAASNPSSD